MTLIMKVVYQALVLKPSDSFHFNCPEIRYEDHFKLLRK